MRPEMFLNELSFATPTHDEPTARKWADDLVRTMAGATRLGVGRALHLPANFYTLPLAIGYCWLQWLDDGRVDRESRQYFRSLATKMPFLCGDPEDQEAWGDMDCFYNGQTALGLKAAYVADGLAVSLQSAPCWDADMVLCEVQQVTDELVDVRKERFRHAARPSHLDLHRAWVQQRLQSMVADGHELWRRASEFFPLLTFCKTVKGGMEALPAEALPSVVRGLCILNGYCAGWQSGAFCPKALGCDVSPESDSTLNKYGAERTFMCPDSQRRTFSWHAKPGRWRIYFDPDAGPGRLLVGYVGKHLRIVSQG